MISEENLTTSRFRKASLNRIGKKNVLIKLMINSFYITVKWSMTKFYKNYNSVFRKIKEILFYILIRLLQNSVHTKI